jgi:uncharacterized protein YjbI with pentapeptide repeats
MISQLQLWRKKIKEYPKSSIIIFIAIVIGIALITVIILGYYLNWAWTGLGPYTPPTKDSNFQRGKTLWDWLNLLGVLAIPLAVGFGTMWFTAQQGKASNAENTDNQREAALQEYIDKISDLLLYQNLRESVPTLSIDSNLVLTGIEIKQDEEVRTIARSRTLTVLSRLDKRRKRSVLQFLHESGLIEKNRCIINLSEADLSAADLSLANLEGADLKKANLREADLTAANLREANLREANLFKATPFAANLSGADLSKANLSRAFLWVTNLRRANLTNADLSHAKLSGADLRGANLTNADLRGANLSDTKVTLEQLTKAKSLKGATMPDGTIHP